MPLRTCYPEDDHLAVRPVLREGFARLTNLEEFVSTRDELYLDVMDGERAYVWSAWPKLKRLALWNVDVGQEFWRHVAQHSSLESLVLSNSDSLDQVNPKAEYFKYSDRPLRVVFCRTRQYRRSYPVYLHTADWNRYDPELSMTMFAHPLPNDDNNNVLCLAQQQVKHAAHNGTLWAWEGEKILYATQISLVL